MKRARLQGVRDVMRFNWPTFAVASVLAVAGLVGFWVFVGPLRFVSLLVGLGAFAGLSSALLATHYIYDRSELYRWSWLHELGGAPKRVLAVHTGFDESSAALAELFPEAVITVCDIYDPRYATEPSIARARGSKTPGLTATADAIPLPNASADLVVGFLALHEIRDPKARAQMFAELRRIGGRLIVVEHLRNWANLLVYGPGAFHFLPRSAWVTPAGLKLVHERAITPFVRVFTYEAA